MTGTWPRRAARLLALVFEMGPRGMAEYLLARLGLSTGERFRLHTRQSAHPLTLRRHSSDLAVYHQIYVLGQYGPLPGLDRLRCIIDCGAYTGLSGAYFLSRSPDAQLVAIEPDPANVALLRENLAPFGDRAAIHHAAIWSEETTVDLATTPYGDGREWSRQVVPAAPGATGIPGLEIGKLLSASGHSRIDLLKIDIEGAEAVIFAHPPAWLALVDRIAIELHDDTRYGPATEPFLKAVTAAGFITSRSGELTLCVRP